MSPLELLIAGGAAFLAGGVNALAGGGTLISFPALIAIGLPPVSANITNTVALCPGYLGAALSQRRLLVDQRARLRRLALAAGVGGLLGSILLVLTSDDTFRTIIPILLFAATLLLATQDRIRAALGIGGGAAAASGGGLHPTGPDPRWLPIPILVVSVYGGYFGAGLGIMLLAVLGVVLHDALPRLNALKQGLSLVINVTAALFFVTSGKVYWAVALVMAVTSLAGGTVGGRMAGSIDPLRLRRVVVTIGFVVSIGYAVRIWA